MQTLELATNDDGSETWQERIVQWRYQSNSIPKRIAGFWLKAGIEAGVVVGVPVGLFVLAATALANVEIAALSTVHLENRSRLVTWLLLTLLCWAPVRCLLTDELQFVTQRE